MKMCGLLKAFGKTYIEFDYKDTNHRPWLDQQENYK
jgi:hypothetical protein